VIVRNRHIPRIAHDINDSLVAWIEALVAFDDARPLQISHLPVGMDIHVGDQSLQVEESDWIVLVDKVTNQESGPGVAGAGK